MRLLVFYLLGIPVSLICHASLPINLLTAGDTEQFFVLLAVIAGLSTLTKPLLLLFTAWKAFFDLSLLRNVLRATTGGFIDILPFNACLLFLFISLFVYLAAAASAEYFTFQTTARDGKLLRLGAFWRYLALSFAFLAASVVLALVWRQIYPLLS